MTISKAIFSEDRKYRYRLERVWNTKLPLLVFVMLNPSYGNENINDNTIERCQRRAMMLGYGGIVVVNIFAWVSTDPSVLAGLEDPIGDENNTHIISAALEAKTVVCGWGTNGEILGRGAQVIEMLQQRDIVPHALRLTKAGHPEHPLYIPYSCQPTPINQLERRT